MPRSLESELTALRAQVRDLQQLVYGLLSRQGKGTPGERFLNVELNAELTPGGTVGCSIMDWNGTTEVDSGANVYATDRGYNFAGVEANKALIRFNWLAQRWEFVQLECDPEGLGEDTPADTVVGEIESEF